MKWADAFEFIFAYSTFSATLDLSGICGFSIFFWIAAHGLTTEGVVSTQWCTCLRKMQVFLESKTSSRCTHFIDYNIWIHIRIHAWCLMESTNIYFGQRFS